MYHIPICITHICVYLNLFLTSMVWKLKKKKLAVYTEKNNSRIVAMDTSDENERISISDHMDW